MGNFLAQTPTQWDKGPMWRGRLPENNGRVAEQGCRRRVEEETILFTYQME